MPVPHLSVAVVLFLDKFGFKSQNANLKISHGLSIAILSDKPRIAYARMDDVINKPFDSKNMRDVLAQLAGKGVEGVVYDFQNFHALEAIRFTLDNIWLVEDDFQMKRTCFSPDWGVRNLYSCYLSDYFGSASKEASNNWHYVDGNLANALNEMDRRIEKVLK